MSKQTYTCEKRPKHIKRDLSKRTTNTKTYTSQKLCHIRFIHVKETYTCQKRPTNVKRDLYMSKTTYKCEKRLIHVKNDLQMWRETYTCQKRRNMSKKKRPTHVRTHVMGHVSCVMCHVSCVHPRWGRCVICDVAHTKVTYQKRHMYVKRDLYVWSKPHECIQSEAVVWFATL